MEDMRGDARGRACLVGTRDEREKGVGERGDSIGTRRGKQGSSAACRHLRVLARESPPMM